MEPPTPSWHRPFLYRHIAGCSAPDSNGQRLAEKKGPGMAVSSPRLLDYALGVWKGSGNEGNRNKAETEIKTELAIGKRE